MGRENKEESREIVEIEEDDFLTNSQTIIAQFIYLVAVVID